MLVLMTDKATTALLANHYIGRYPYKCDLIIILSECIGRSKKVSGGYLSLVQPIGLTLLFCKFYKL